MSNGEAILQLKDICILWRFDGPGNVNWILKRRRLLGLIGPIGAQAKGSPFGFCKVGIQEKGN